MRHAFLNIFIVLSFSFFFEKNYFWAKYVVNKIINFLLIYLCVKDGVCYKNFLETFLVRFMLEMFFVGAFRLCGCHTPFLALLKGMENWPNKFSLSF